MTTRASSGHGLAGMDIIDLGSGRMVNRDTAAVTVSALGRVVGA